jgi:hypothetical protein
MKQKNVTDTVHAGNHQGFSCICVRLRHSLVIPSGNAGCTIPERKNGMLHYPDFTDEIMEKMIHPVGELTQS